MASPLPPSLQRQGVREGQLALLPQGSLPPCLFADLERDALVLSHKEFAGQEVNSQIPETAAGMHLNASYKMTMNPQIDASVPVSGRP